MNKFISLLVITLVVIVLPMVLSYFSTDMVVEEYIRVSYLGHITTLSGVYTQFAVLYWLIILMVGGACTIVYLEFAD